MLGLILGGLLVVTLFIFYLYRRQLVMSVASLRLISIMLFMVGYSLLHYAYACELWSFIFCLFGMSWVIPTRVIDLGGAVVFVVDMVTRGVIIVVRPIILSFTIG